MIDEKHFEFMTADEAAALRKRNLIWMKGYVVSMMILAPIIFYSATLDGDWILLAVAVYAALTVKTVLVVRSGVGYPKSVAPKVNQVDDFLDAGDLVSARRLCEEQLKRGRKSLDWLAQFLIRLAVIEFMEGDAKSGIRLGNIALESGWLEPYDSPAATDWIIMMWIHLGEVEKAKAMLEVAALPFFSQILLMCHFEEWERILELIHPEEPLDDTSEDPETSEDDFGMAGFLRVLKGFTSVIGRYAAIQLGRPTSKFDHGAANLPGRVTLNPTLTPYLPERRVLMS